MLESDILCMHKSSKRAERRREMLTSIEAERVRKGLTKEELAKKLVQRIINNCYIKPMPLPLH